MSIFVIYVHIEGFEVDNAIQSQRIEASNLTDALQAAAQLPLSAWFPEEDQP